MISLRKFGFSYSDKKLFSDVDVDIYFNDKIGLVGKNGSGKTTLLNILASNIDNYYGEKIVNPNINIGFLPQEINFSMDDLTPFGLCKKAFIDVENKINKLSELSQKLNDQNAQLEYDRILNELNKNNLFSYEYKIKVVLSNLGLNEEEINIKFSKLSSGFKVRAYLGYLMLLMPDLLLLDEPTNYLDIDAIQYLIEFLKSYPKSFIIVSHDKNLLDSVINKIWDIFAGKIYIYSNCNYTSFIERKEQFLENLEKKAKDIELKIKKQKEFIERFKAKASKASSVQSRIKALEKLEKIEIPRESTIDFSIKTSDNTFSNILSCENLTFAYDEKLILNKVHFSILRKDRIFLIGRNGIGKTTFLKLLTNELKPQQGKVVVHNNSKIGYFEQNASLKASFDYTVYDYFLCCEDAKKLTETERKKFLAAFGFNQDDVYKKLSVLSGGEKVRLMLSRIFLSRPDILILDEPTTHLDIMTKEILIENLFQYNGALLIVSHDIDFSNRLAQKFITIDEYDIVWLYSISEYFEKSKKKTNKTYKKHTEKDFINKNYNKIEDKSKLKNQLSTNQRQQIQKKIIEYENELLILDEKIKKIENEFAENLSYEQIKKITEQYNNLQKEYEEKFEKLVELEELIR